LNRHLLVAIQVSSGAETTAIPGWSCDEKAVVIYWYQSQNRIIASEYSAKFWLIPDSIRYQRSGTALVKSCSTCGKCNPKSATALGVSFVEARFPDFISRLS
jgi:hypothetical protein